MLRKSNFFSCAPSQYASATQDDVNGDVFYDALDSIAPSEDIFYFYRENIYSWEGVFTYLLNRSFLKIL